MEKYRLVNEERVDSDDVQIPGETDDFPEVRITQQGKPRNYISYAMSLLVCDKILGIHVVIA